VGAARSAVPLAGDLTGGIRPIERSGHGFAGTPAGAREYIAEQAEQGGANYVVCDLAFGDITFDEAMRSVELFAKEVMPAFAEA